MAPVKMRRGTANYLVREAAGEYRSRDKGVVVNGDTEVLAAGSLLGLVSTGSASSSAKADNTGNATIGAITVGSAAQAGRYTIEFLTATTFAVKDPEDRMLPNGATGTAYNNGGLSFTITAGATPMVAGDERYVDVAQAPGMYKRHTLGATDGSQTVAGILFEELEPGATEPRTITTRACEVNGAHLIYAAGSTDAQKVTANTALLALGIVVR